MGNAGHIHKSILIKLLCLYDHIDVTLEYS